MAIHNDSPSKALAIRWPLTVASRRIRFKCFATIVMVSVMSRPVVSCATMDPVMRTDAVALIFRHPL